MESRFGADFGSVRVHSDPEAARLSNQLSARAFTYQNHVFFSRDQYQPGTSEGKHLLAHELTHTIQQGHAVQRSPQAITTTVTPPPVQRLGVQDALDYFADKAYYIPGFRMLTIVLGFNPINMRSTDRSAANILRALIELVPGGHFITQALDNHGVFTKAGAWVEQKLATLGDIGSDIVDGLNRFIDSLSWTDIFDLGGVWDRAKRIFTGPISRLISFAGSVVSEILKMVKDAILRPLAALAQNTRGYDLLKAILGEDPITGEPVPRNADTLIGGFMKLIGQEEVWNNIKKGNAVARAWAWFQGALSGLMGFVRAIPRRVIDTITSLTFQDIVTVAGAFTKVVGAFVNIAGEFISWGFNQVVSLLEILFSVVAPGVMPYIKKAQAAFITIIKNPIAFVGNLVRAGKQGFELFASRIGEHLKTALIKWITGPLGEAAFPGGPRVVPLTKRRIDLHQEHMPVLQIRIDRDETSERAYRVGSDMVGKRPFRECHGRSTEQASKLLLFDIEPIVVFGVGGHGEAVKQVAAIHGKDGAGVGRIWVLAHSLRSVAKQGNVGGYRKRDGVPCRAHGVDQPGDCRTQSAEVPSQCGTGFRGGGKEESCNGSSIDGLIGQCEIGEQCQRLRLKCERRTVTLGVDRGWTKEAQHGLSSIH
jgi:hypothetical protein